MKDYLLSPMVAKKLEEGYEKSGKLELAKEQYELAIELNYVRAYPNLARVLVNQGKHEDGAADRYTPGEIANLL